MPRCQLARRLVVRSEDNNRESSSRFSKRAIKLKIDVSVAEAIPADDQNALRTTAWPEHAPRALCQLREGVKLRLTVLGRGRPNEDAPLFDPRDLKAVSDSPW
jgi:hypothetical protein